MQSPTGQDVIQQKHYSHNDEEYGEHETASSRCRCWRYCSHHLLRSIQNLVPRARLAPLLYTLEFQIEFLHFALVLHLPRVQPLVDLCFQTLNFGDIDEGHNQHDHTERTQRSK